MSSSVVVCYLCLVSRIDEGIDGAKMVVLSSLHTSLASALPLSLLHGFLNTHFFMRIVKETHFPGLRKNIPDYAL